MEGRTGQKLEKIALYGIIGHRPPGAAAQKREEEEEEREERKKEKKHQGAIWMIETETTEIK